MIERIEQLRVEGEHAVAQAPTTAVLEEVRVRHLGRRAELPNLLRGVADLPPDQRGQVGKAANQARQALEALIAARTQELEAAELDVPLAAYRVDVTLPGRRVRGGARHPLELLQEEIADFFVAMGWEIAEGPEVEHEWFNFDALNHGPDHPARQMADTFHVAGTEQQPMPGLVLRTHTSPVQARVMTTQPPPMAIVVPGRTFRADAVDATHSPVFTQIEGLYVDEDVTMGDLRGTLLTLARALFGDDRDIRLRPGFFPFTEPSAEIDVSCGFCTGDGRGGGRVRRGDGAPCRVCAGTGWIEILGSGMVDPNVLDACGIDTARWSGFAFGIGIERVAMLRHGIADIRDLFEGDARFLEQF